MSETAELLFDVGDERLLTIGTVVERLRAEFPDISVSKLRYLEEQGLVTPRRTKSGYRLYSQDDFSRLVRVLSMQRDEYLPLKVIRRELERSPASPLPTARQGLRKTDLLSVGEGREYTSEEVVQLTGADVALLDELEDYELIHGRQVSGVKRYSETDAGIVAAAAQLAQLGLRPKNLRVHQERRRPRDRPHRAGAAAGPALQPSRAAQGGPGPARRHRPVLGPAPPAPARARRPPAHRRLALRQPRHSQRPRAAVAPEGDPMTDAGFDLAAHVRDIPDFPKEGILFRDIMPLLQEPRALREAVDRLVEYGTGKHVDVVMGAEARGFILGAAVAYGLGAGFVCARKPGKLPHDTISAEYALEYGTDKLEVHADAIKPGQNVLVHDDLLATGGTARAKVELVEQLGGKVVGVAFIIELSGLQGRDKLEGYDVFSLITY